jgi:hypothetical protein
VIAVAASKLEGFLAAGQAAQAAVDKLAGRVTISLTGDQARALHWLTRHLSFSDALESVPPHLPAAIRKDRAYGLIHAASALQDALEKADRFGDSWMYEEPM